MKYFAVLLAILLLAGSSMASVGTVMYSGVHSYIAADDGDCDGGVCPLPPDDDDHGSGHDCDGGVCPLPDNG